MIGGRTLWGAVAVGALLALSSFGYAQAVHPPAAPSKLDQFGDHIRHIVFLMQENRAYDNFYGTYCLTLSKYCAGLGNGIPPGTCVPMYPGTPSPTCHAPFPLTASHLSTPDIPHDWYSTHIAYNYGKMNGFWAAEGHYNQTFGHYDQTTIPVYWDLAEQYGLADNFFSSAMTYSLSNHWFIVGASAPSAGVVQFPPWASVSIQHKYLNQSNATPTIEDRLLNSTVPWKYYDYALSSYPSAINNLGCCGGGGAYDFWNPLAARHVSYSTLASPHFVDRSQFFADAANGTLPEVSWIIASACQTDHAPCSVADGQNWSASVANALENSPEWNSTVLFESWDEYGGWYDHVAPPHVDSLGDSLRVPLLAIGPWVKQGVIDHTQMDFSSILHLMEVRFGLACLGLRDCHANLPLGLFDFTGAPRAPIDIPYYGNASYPMPLQSSGQLPPFSVALAAPAPGPPPSSDIAFIGGDPD